MLAFGLLGKERRTALSDVERVSQVVGNNARKLVEALVLLAQLSLSFDALSVASSLYL